ncbi:MFS transporter [Fodinibacter luteus]|uniref:MFS transporter n=1 Tax=Fodinibacter luteus TaxID=552064 RepID=A0ABP8KJT2_9MICO
MSQARGPEVPTVEQGSRRLMVLLAMAMFVLVVDTSLMNVSISAVIEDLDTTASGVQSAIALEALVSAAFILINSKVGDLIGRKRAYVLGLLAYAVGALAMTLTQSLTAIVIFWAIIGGLGASLLLPAMQSLIHGNFSGAAQKQAYALIGAAAAIAAAVGPLLGGFVTTYLSWRVGFALEVVIIAVVLSQIRLVKDVAYTGSRQVDVVGAVLSVLGMGGVVLGILVWQEGGEFVLLLMAVGAVALGSLAWWLTRRKRAGQVTLLDPDLFRSPNFTAGISAQMLQQVALGGSMIALPLFLQMTLEYNAMEAGLSLAPLSLTMFAAAVVAGKRAGDRRPARIIRTGFILAAVGVAVIIVMVPVIDSGWYLALPLVVTGCGLGLLVSQLNNYTLAPIEEERISEAAGVNSAAGSFGLSFGLAMAGGVMLAALAFSFTSLTEASTVIPPAQQEQIATVLEEDAEIMSTSALDAQISGQPPEVEAEVLAINDTARNRSLQIALLVPLLAALLGLANSFRMLRLPDVKPSASLEGLDLG